MPNDNPNQPLPKVDRFTELGSPGLFRTGGFVLDDILPQLRGRQAQIAYRDMADNDAIVGAVLTAVERIMLQVDWQVRPYDDPSQPGSDPTDDDQLAATFLRECMDDMSHSWHELLIAILTFLPYGWSFFEIVYKRRQGPTQTDPKRRSKYNDNKIAWRKIALRNQDSLWMWMFDDNGGITGFIQRDPTTGRMNTIPIQKALLFRTTAARGNPEGRSVLRNAFRSWYFKRRLEEIEAIGMERDLAGIPMGRVPAEWMSADASDADKLAFMAMQSIVRGVKRNNNDGIVLPYMADPDNPSQQMVTFELLTSGGTRQFDTGKVIDRYNTQIAMTMLADFIMLGHENVGSFALGASKVDLFVAAVESWVRSIAETFNSHAIPRLMALNGFDPERLPKLTYGQVSAVDLMELGTYLANLAKAGLVTADNGLEEHLRELAGLPNFRADPDGGQENERYGDPAMLAQATQQAQIAQGAPATEPSDPNNAKPSPASEPTDDGSDEPGGKGGDMD